MCTEFAESTNVALSQEERAAVFAHILERNGYPAGRVALTEDLPQLRKERLEVAVLDRANRPEPPAFIAGTDGGVPASFGPDQDTLGRRGGLHRLAGPQPRLLGYAPLALDADRCGERLAAGARVHVSRVTVALDAATCRVKWRHTWEPKDDTLWNRNRGIAIKDGRVVRGQGTAIS